MIIVPKVHLLIACNPHVSGLFSTLNLFEMIFLSHMSVEDINLFSSYNERKFLFFLLWIFSFFFIHTYTKISLDTVIKKIITLDVDGCPFLFFLPFLISLLCLGFFIKFMYCTMHFLMCLLHFRFSVLFHGC